LISYLHEEVALLFLLYSRWQSRRRRGGSQEGTRDSQNTEGERLRAIDMDDFENVLVGKMMF
jgi:hypothetical protein